MNASCGHPRDWAGLYRRDYDLVTPASTAHPAKASWDLAFKILEHLEELGLANPTTDTILDFMAGTGRFPLAACAKGYRSIGLELEPRFVEFCQQNKAYAEKKLGRGLDWQIIQGDARHLSQLLQERGLVSVVSPPYSNLNNEQRIMSKRQDGMARWLASERPLSLDKSGAGSIAKEYGSSPGQIGSLPDRPYIGVTSPPYEDSDMAKVSDGIKREHPGRRMWANEPYNQSEGQIGQERGLTYLSEMKKIYAEAAKVCSVMVVVVKCPTRAGRLHRLDLSTIALLEATNWHVHCVHRALLFEELEQGDLFQGSKKRVKGRMGFFKRLQWQKGKSEIAQWEDVIVATREGEGLKAVVSPPYATDLDGFPASKAPDGKSNIFMEVKDRLEKPARKEGYGNTPGQIGRLKDA